jgi:hypothetical protein
MWIAIAAVNLALAVILGPSALTASRLLLHQNNWAGGEQQHNIFSIMH